MPDLHIQRETNEQAFEHDLCGSEIGPVQLQVFDELTLPVDKRIHFRHAALGLGQSICF